MVVENSHTEVWNWWISNGFAISAGARGDLFHRLSFIRNSSLGIDRIGGNSPDRNLFKDGAGNAGSRRLLDSPDDPVAELRRSHAGDGVDSGSCQRIGGSVWKIAAAGVGGCVGALVVGVCRWPGLSLVPVGPAAG